MSLLMDALKKAEEEKKRAAKQLQEVEESPRTEDKRGEEKTTGKAQSSDQNTSNDREKKPASDHLELTLAPLERNEVSETDERRLTEEEEKALDSTHEELEVSREFIDEAKQKQRNLDKDFSEELTIEGLPAEKVRDESLEATIEAPREEMHLDDSAIIEGLMTNDEPAAPSFDDTFHGVVFDDDEGSNYEETLPGVTAEQLSRDLGGGAYQPTPVAAKTVFNAGRANKKKNSFKWGIFSVLVILAVGSFAIFYYFSITPVARKMPPPDVARGIESTPAAIPRIPPVSSDSVSGTLIARESAVGDVAETEIETVEPALVETETATVVANVEGSEAADVEMTDSGTEAVDAMADVQVQPEPEATAATLPPAEESVADVTEQEPVEQTPVATQLPEYIELDQQSMRISKESRDDTEAVLVRQGFDAFQRGDYGMARSLYQDALSIDADNRDAHLGLAAIAIKFNDLQEAFTHYKSILNVNPDDAMAMSALQSMNKNVDPVKAETAIKLLLQKEADNPYLYFNLGNIFARQQRWPEAQQAFFDAFRLDDSNAAYAMNLAVSLDYMEQYAAAIRYYKSALELALAGDASLDAGKIQQRINSLTSVVQN
ncbi:MAG: tetratricopeptide repeat protein [Gammaproteobacteria bacterium]